MACVRDNESALEMPVAVDTAPLAQKRDILTYDHPEATQIITSVIKPEELVAFAQTLKGVPYQYASCDPGSGFDCSGFIYYVFGHFGITVPRSSADFTNLGYAVDRKAAKAGDLILFTGTDRLVISALCCPMSGTVFSSSIRHRAAPMASPLPPSMATMQAG